MPNAFIGRPDPPSDDNLTDVLGSAQALWDQLVAGLGALGVGDREWNSYSVKAGWAMRLKHKGRNIVYLSPCAGCFVASFALGDRAVEAACQSDLPPATIQNTNGSRRYAEGTAVRIEVHSAEDITCVLRLASIKMGN